MGRKPGSRYEATSPSTMVCIDWPSVTLHVQRGLTVDEAQRSSYPEQCIFLDGVFNGPAFLDNEKRQYSLDHHAGCVRAFTLATCEQACVMLVQRLPIWEGRWHLYVNEPDLDALLAAWVLLNHYALSHDDFALLRKVMPLIRVEGVIDSYGFDKAVLSGLPRRIHDAKLKRIRKLRSAERKLREDGQWADIDPAAFSLSQLETMDQQLFPRGNPRTSGIVDLDAAPSSNRIAVLVKSQRGIYEVEDSLRERHGDQLGLVVLDAGNGRVTVRLVDRFLKHNLEAAYPALNAWDPNVRQDDGNVWGGSDEIGGSPRATGTALSGYQILDIVKRALREGPPTPPA